jgi:hypothetical protein
MIKFRARLKYFFVNPNQDNSSLRKKVARVRFVYINSVTFILFWVPYGIGISFYKNTTLQERYQAFTESSEDWEEGGREDSIYFYILASLFYCYLLLLPLIVFGTNDAFLSCCCTKQQQDEQQCDNNITNGNEVTTVARSSQQGIAETQV